MRKKVLTEFKLSMVKKSSDEDEVSTVHHGSVCLQVVLQYGKLAGLLVVEVDDFNTAQNRRSWPQDGTNVAKR